MDRDGLCDLQVLFMIRVPILVLLGLAQSITYLCFTCIHGRFFIMIWNTSHLCMLEILFNDPEYLLLWLSVDLACLKSSAQHTSISIYIYIFRMDSGWMDLDFGGGGLDWIG